MRPWIPSIVLKKNPLSFQWGRQFHASQPPSTVGWDTSLLTKGYCCYYITTEATVVNFINRYSFISTYCVLNETNDSLYGLYYFHFLMRDLKHRKARSCVTHSILRIKNHGPVFSAKPQLFNIWHGVSKAWSNLLQLHCKGWRRRNPSSKLERTLLITTRPKLASEASSQNILSHECVISEFHIMLYNS